MEREREKLKIIEGHQKEVAETAEKSGRQGSLGGARAGSYSRPEEESASHVG